MNVLEKTDKRTLVLGKFVPTGFKFDRLTLIRGDYISYKRKGKFLCSCGTKKEIAISSVFYGLTHSCGCKKRENLKATQLGNIKHGHAFGGKKLSPEYRSWTAMRERVFCSTRPRYRLWGGRGIKICERWNSFNNFLEDMGKRPPGTTLDRINNDGNYEPDNCRWATILEQNRNRRKSTKTNDIVAVLGSEAASSGFVALWLLFVMLAFLIGGVVLQEQFSPQCLVTAP